MEIAAENETTIVNEIDNILKYREKKNKSMHLFIKDRMRKSFIVVGPRTEFVKYIYINMQIRIN